LQSQRELKNARWNNETGEYHSVSVRSILIAYPSLHLSLPSGLLPLCFDIRILHTFFSSPIVSDLIALTMRGEQHKSWSPHLQYFPFSFCFLPHWPEYTIYSPYLSTKTMFYTLHRLLMLLCWPQWRKGRGAQHSGAKSIFFMKINRPSGV